MKTTSLLVLLMFFLSAQAIAAVPEAPDLATEGVFAAFGSKPGSSALIHDTKFDFLSTEAAAKLGVSKEQMESYNRDLDVLNVMMLEISSELSAMKKPTIDDAAGLWSGLKGAVSSATLEALKIITKSK